MTKPFDTNYWQGDTVEVVREVSPGDNEGRVVSVFPHDSENAFPSVASGREARRRDVTATDADYRVALWLDFRCDLIRQPDVGDTVEFQRDIAMPTGTLDSPFHCRIQEDIDTVQDGIDHQREMRDFRNALRSVESETYEMGSAQRYGRPPLSPLLRRDQPFPPEIERTRERAPLDDLKPDHELDF